VEEENGRKRWMKGKRKKGNKKEEGAWRVFQKQ